MVYIPAEGSAKGVFLYSLSYTHSKLAKTIRTKPWNTKNTCCLSTFLNLKMINGHLMTVNGY